MHFGASAASTQPQRTARGCHTTANEGHGGNTHTINTTSSPGHPVLCPRDALAHVLLLVDSSLPPQQIDVDCAFWLAECEVRTRCGCVWGAAQKGVQLPAPTGNQAGRTTTASDPHGDRLAGACTKGEVRNLGTRPAAGGEGRGLPLWQPLEVRLRQLAAGRILRWVAPAAGQ